MQISPAAQSDLFLSLWDNLVRDPAQAAAIARVHEDFRLIDRATFHWYARPLGKPGNPDNPLEELAELVIARVQPYRLAGVEYWTNSLATGESMHPHVDKDEKLYWSTKEFRHPYISTVYYPAQAPYEGGELVINNQNLIKPLPNQLIAFRGTLPHGVQRIKSGSRRSIALNLWDRTPGAYKTFEA